jgi:two-component system KDP operon response regulator KdpE
VSSESVGRLLFIDDDDQIRSALGPVLESAGWGVTLAAGGAEALRRLEGCAPDVVVLDMMMPDMNGLEVCRRIREHSRVPVLMLTVKDSPADKVAALDMGADDYLTKPFQTDELLARLRALKRRAEYHLADVVRVGDLSIDLAHRQVKRAGSEIELRRREWEVLALLASEQGKVVSWTRLIEEILDADASADTAKSVPLMRVHVSNLRQRIEPHPAVPRYIITEPGVGLRLVDPG